MTKQASRQVRQEGVHAGRPVDKQAAGRHGRKEGRQAGRATRPSRRGWRVCWNPRDHNNHIKCNKSVITGWQSRLALVQRRRLRRQFQKKKEKRKRKRKEGPVLVGYWLVASPGLVVPPPSPARSPPWSSTGGDDTLIMSNSLSCNYPVNSNHLQHPLAYLSIIEVLIEPARNKCSSDPSWQ